MVTITQDSELMTNYVSANPIPAGQHFAVFRDAQMDPGVFALSEDFYLYLIMVINGQATKIDFGHVSGIVPQGVQVQAFAVVQAPDSTLDICIATPGSGNTTNFALLHNITFTELLSPIQSSKIIRGNFPKVDHIYMSNKSTDTKRTLPLVMVAFQRPDRIISTEDLRFVQFGQSATLLGAWSLATNPKQIVDVVLGTCSLGDGAFVLYESFSGPMHIQFKFFTGSTMVVEPICPAGATCISSYIDPTSHQSILLVGGQNVTAFKASEYCSRTGKGTVIETGDQITGLKDLHVSLSGQTLRFWYTTDADAVHYYTTNSTALSTGTVVPLLPEGRGGQISSMLSLKSSDGTDQTLVSSLVSVDENGNLVLLQQDSVSQLWQTYPFWYASNLNIIELQGYMLRMHATATTDDESSLIPGCWLHVSSSGVVRCIINGRHATLGPTAQWYQTDAKGVLNILLQSDDASCFTFTADAYRAAKPGSPETPLQTPVLDPSVKLIQKLDGVSTPGDVRALRKKDGSPLVSPNASDDDVKAAADSIKVLVDQAHQRQDGSQQLFQSFKASARVATSGMAAVDARFYSAGDFLDDLEGGWHWVESKFEDAWEWGCQFIEDEAGKVWSFIIKIGDEVYSFILETVSVIVKAVTWVFKKLGTLIKDLIDFFGFLFEWDDILATADSIATGFNAALDYGQQLLDKTEFTVDSWLEELRTTIKAQLPTLQNYSYNGTSKAPQRLKAEVPAKEVLATNATDPDSDVKSGVAYNWSTYYFTYGGGTTNAVLHDDGSSDSAEDIILAMWDDIQEELNTIVKFCGNLAQDLIDFFTTGNYDIKSLISRITADVVDVMIDSLKTLADILFKAVSLGINLIKTLSNKDMDIPVIGWLWKKIAGDRAFSLLDLVALLIAIPTTVLYKAKAKVAPPKLTGRLTADTFGQYVSGKADPALSKDINNFTLATATSLELVYGEFKTISLLIDSAFEGSGLESVPIGPVAQLTNVLNATSLTFETINTFIIWPVNEDSAKPTSSSTTTKFIKYSKLGLTLSNFGAAAVANVVAKAKKADQPTIKRWKGTIAAVMAVPTICVALTKDVNDAVEGEVKTDLVVNHFVESFLEFGKQWGFAAASWTNEIEDVVMYIGLAVQQVCTYGGYGCKIYDFVEEYA
ncbi:hypothetical protein TARUN_4887 [Trichoderma arundinaceum]|uniref:Uncharacterized protein n=1 Tax=Trichoderma arundinaceum TaxID=490622 RepID=A0A395NMN1_TRIAR|nr:hypothetical protein TARUN_4887 [Trichoderma arundinaceum]